MMTATAPPSAPGSVQADSAETMEARTIQKPPTLIEVLRPREHTTFILGMLVLATATAWYVQVVRGWKMWQGVSLFLVVMAVPAALKWRADTRRFGGTVAAAGALIVIQALHTIEHVVQWIQRHLLDRPLRQSNGLLSPANSEWVHFVWNWLVVISVVALMIKGLRGWFAVLLLIWATAHAIEHTYMWVRYLQVDGLLNSHGHAQLTAQGLPGIVGNDGWIDRHGGVHASWLHRLPFLTTATRLDTHAVWNGVEVALLIPALSVFLRRRSAESPSSEASREVRSSRDLV